MTSPESLLMPVVRAFPWSVEELDKEDRVLFQSWWGHYNLSTRPSLPLLRCLLFPGPPPLTLPSSCPPGALHGSRRKPSGGRETSPALLMSNNLFYDRKGNCLQFHKSETNSFEVVCPAAGKRFLLSLPSHSFSPPLSLFPSNYCSFQAVGMSQCQTVRCELPQDLTSWVWMGDVATGTRWGGSQFSFCHAPSLTWYHHGGSRGAWAEGGSPGPWRANSSGLGRPLAP